MFEEVVEEGLCHFEGCRKTFEQDEFTGLQENRSTATRMVVKPLEAGKSVAKSIPRWDQGRREIGRVCPQADDVVWRSWTQTENRS